MITATEIGIEHVEQIIEKLSGIDQCLLTIVSFIVIIIVIILCHYIYKFFNMFF